MATRPKVFYSPVCSIQFRDAGGDDVQERERERLTLKALPSEKLLKLASGTISKGKVFGVLMEGALRGMLNREGERRLVALLDEKDAARVRNRIGVSGRDSGA